MDILVLITFRSEKWKTTYVRKSISYWKKKAETRHLSSSYFQRDAKASGITNTNGKYTLISTTRDFSYRIPEINKTKETFITSQKAI